MNWNFRGVGTALVTPFRSDLSVDYDKLRQLIKRQIENGIKCLVPVGTTGEAVTLELSEWREVISQTVQEASGKAIVLAGVGGNCTKTVIDRAKEAFDLGVDGVLAVTPYYNKPTQEGLFDHFRRVAQEVKGPIVLYNVPSRTGVNMSAQTTIRLQREFENIVGIKESSGNLSQIMQIISQRREGFRVYSGDDNLTLPITTLGGDGVISVVSNETPDLMNQLVEFIFENKLDMARRLHYRLLPLMEINFIETSPAPVKYALSRMGLIENVLRPPLVPVTDSSSKQIDQVLRELELIDR